MEFYFTDRQYNLLGIASTERGRFRIAGEVEAQSTTASTVALTGNVYFVKEDLNDAINMCVGEGGNYILYEDDRGVGHFMTIQNTQVDNAGCSINFQADDAGNDLKNEIVGAYTATKAMTFAQYFSMFCADSGWEIGLNEIPTSARTLEFTSEQTSYDRMLEVANGFGVSLYYTFEINGLEPVHRYLNVVNKLGSTTNVTLRQGTDISQIVSETSTADLHTSIKAYGATPDGAATPINLAGYKWTDNTGQFVLGSDGVLRDTIAIRTWSRLRSNANPTPESSHLQMVKTYEATTQATLMQSALADLKTYNHPAVNYTVTMARVPSELTKGDVVNVEDEAQNLYLSATVLEVDKCYSMPSSSTLTLGDFKIEHDQTSTQIKQMAQMISQIPAGKDGVDAVVLSVSSVNGNMFKNTGISTILTVSISVGGSVLDTAEKMHAVFGADAYLQWQVKNVGELEFADVSLTDKRLSDEGFLFAVSAEDVNNKSTFKCELYY
ncbi:phage tail spike protein [Lacticaseibacillus jixiensis]|uniref:phage tail spike protein n=1 Tax=Lacticaseibacillus jixiensis TaxID=3231926 RepID=UPI0036F2C11C